MHVHMALIQFYVKVKEGLIFIINHKKRHKKL